MPELPIIKVIEDGRNHKLVKFHRGATDEEVMDAIRILNVKWPKSYVHFLKKCGWADLGGDVVYGLGKDAKKAESVYEISIFESIHATPPMRHSLIPLMNDGAGNHECLDTKKIKDGDCPVVLWQHDHPRGELQAPKLISKSFTLWLKKKIRDLPEVV